MDLVKNWFTFSAEHMRHGSYTGNWYSDYNNIILGSSTLDWKARAYCQNCGAVYSGEAITESCLECGFENWRILVCRTLWKKEKIEIEKVWWKPTTWKGYKIVEKLIWEYRIKEDEFKLDIPTF